MGFLDPNSWANALSDDPTGSVAAAQTQAGWEQQGIDLKKKQYDDSVARMQPWTDAGKAAEGRFTAATGPGGQIDPSKRFTVADFQNSPLYQSMMAANKMGADSISAQGSASGMLGSGNMQNQLMKNAQQNALLYEPMAFNEWSGQNTQQFNEMSSLANPNPAQQVSQWGVNLGNQVGNSLSNMGTNFGNAITTNRGANNQAASNLSGQAGQGLGNWLMADSGTQWEDTAGSGNYVDTSNAGNMWNNISNWFAE